MMNLYIKKNGVKSLFFKNLKSKAVAESLAIKYCKENNLNTFEIINVRDEEIFLPEGTGISFIIVNE